MLSSNYLKTIDSEADMNTKPRGRFAPSPSGRLHLGNMLSSLLAWLDVRSLGGELLFRLEDLDPERSWDEYARLMAEDLRWLGLDWDLGWPEDPSCRQGLRTGRYEAAFERLQSLGLVYPCWCSRAERLAASAPHPGEERPSGCKCRYYTGAERAAQRRAPAAKVIVPDEDILIADGHYGPYRENLAREGGDFIIRRSDGVFAYQLAVSVDDMEMGVTRVVRARDLLPSAPRQKWLIETLGGEAPDYCHAPLLTAPGGRKLSKREGDLNMAELRRRFTPEELTGRLAHMCGLIDRPEPVTPAELVPHFSWDKVSREDVILPEAF